jgi:hypothetical protein
VVGVESDIALNDPDTARLAALSALRSWAIRRDRLAADRASLLAAAWRTGARNIRELARLSDVSRNTVYTDLQSQGIDPAGRDSAPVLPPRYEPLRHEDVHELAEVMAGRLRNSMLAEDPGHLATAAWMAAKLLSHIARILDRHPPDDFDRSGLILDIAACAETIREEAHQLCADELAEDELAVVVQNDQVLRADEQQAVIDKARLSLTLPNGSGIEIDLGYQASGAGVWATWNSTSPYLTGTVDGFAHLEISAALATLAALLSDQALDPAALTDE